MPYLPTAQSFLEQSTLLISARPTTARISTKYTIPHPSPPPTDFKPSSQRPSSPPPASSRSRTQRESKKQATLTLKCYDPISGTCLKYRTDKQAEVGRLIAGLGGCGRVMAGLPPKKAEEKVEEVMDVDGPGKSEARGTEGKEKEGAKEGKAQQNTEAGKGQGQGGGGKKKKKGRR